MCSYTKSITTFWLIQTGDSTTVFFPYRFCFHLVVEDGLGRGQEGKAPAVCSQEDLEHRGNCESPKSKVGRTERTKNALLWQYRLWSFQAGCTKSERIFAKKQHTQRKLLNFGNWCNGEVLKSAKIQLSKSIF